jgi:hypothetical protein
MFYSLVQTNRCLLCRGGGKDVDHLFFDCPFSQRIWYDLCFKCLIPFNYCPWASTVVWPFILGRCNSLQFLVIRLMSATTVYHIWKERNDRLYGEAPRNDSVVYSDIVQCIVTKVNICHNMASSHTNRKLHIVWRVY